MVLSVAGPRGIPRAGIVGVTVVVEDVDGGGYWFGTEGALFGTRGLVEAAGAVFVGGAKL